MGKVYGWLSWANQGTTRGLRYRPFDAVLLRRDGGNREVPPGGVGSPRGPREGPQVSDRAADGRKWGGGLGPPTHAPPTVRRHEGARATSRGREGGDNERGGNLLPRSPLTADR